LPGIKSFLKNEIWATVQRISCNGTPSPQITPPCP